jgi:hypothetical protein
LLVAARNRLGITGFVISARFPSKTLGKARCHQSTPINVTD